MLVDSKAMPVIKWTKARVDRLQKAYDKAVSSKAETFIFEENEYLTAYAKYLLEYLAMSDPE
jgi:hypothetical protein